MLIEQPIIDDHHVACAKFIIYILHYEKGTIIIQNIL